jgi:hypothetical protein
MARYYGQDERLKYLFVTLLETPDVGIEDVLEELKSFKAREITPINDNAREQLVEFYDTLDNMATGDKELEILRCVVSNKLQIV